MMNGFPAPLEYVVDELGNVHGVGQLIRGTVGHLYFIERFCQSVV